MRAHHLLVLVLGLTLLGVASCGGGPTSKSNEAAKSPAKSEQPDQPKGVREGQRAPSFSLRDVTDGGLVTLPRGKVTLLVFWATWGVGPRELPKVQELHARFGDARLAVIGISVDDEDHHQEVAPAAKTYGARFPIVWDVGHKLGEAYRIPAEPTTFVIDQNGIVYSVHEGFRDDTTAALERDVQTLLAGKRK